MARKTTKSPSRLELRKAHDAAEKLAESGEAPVKKKAEKKVAEKKPAAKRKSTKKKAEAQRMRMVWGVFDNGNQQVASFPYSDRKAAENKIVDLADKGRGPYFIQPVREPIIETKKADDDESEA